MENQDIFFRNNTGIKSKTAIVDGFVVRISEFDDIMKYLVGAKREADLQNMIVVGQRGAGKTTLLHRTKYAIEDDKSLSKKYLPIIFSEEQYNLSDLTNLWEAIAIVVEDEFAANDLSRKIEFLIENEADFESKSLECIVDYLKQQQKVALVFIENINFFLRKLDADEKKRFTAVFSDARIPIRIIGSSTTYNDGNIDFGSPIFELFRIIQLDGLSQEECEKLLIAIGKQYGELRQIKNVIASYPGRVESLRRLTGGVPRTISYLFQIFLDNENGKAIKDLYLLIDNLSLLYKSELDQLSTQQQKVVDAIARKWDAISVKDVVKKTRLESKNVSTILAYLEKNQIVEKILTTTKNHLYRIRERFMNIWYLMRFGRKHDQANVIWLVRFFDAWCDESELTKKAKNYMDNLKDGNYDESAAIDMGNTFLSCENIPASIKEEILKTSDSVLPGRLLKSKLNEASALKGIKELAKKGELQKAILLLEKLQDRNLDYFMVATSIYLSVNEKEKALESINAARALDYNNPYIAITLGFIYEAYFKDIAKAVKIYEECLQLSQPHPYAASRLGEIAYHEKDYERALEYHKIAAAKNFKKSIQAIPEIYIRMGEYDEAESYLSDAVSSKIKGANIVQYNVLKKLGKKKEAKAALLNAVSEKEEDSNYLLGKYYLAQKRPNFKKAEEQFEITVEKGSVKGYIGLARVSIKQGDIERAISLYQYAVDKNSAQAAHQLGHLYYNLKEFGKSDEMFAKAIELGDFTVLGCWIQSIYKAQRNDKKEFVLALMDEHRDETGINALVHELLYAKMLLWNDQLDASLAILDQHTGELIDLDSDQFDENDYTNRVLSEVVEYFLLLLAKKKYRSLLELFENKERFDYKVMMRPVYYLLMLELKEDYPSEYLKAGKELGETIDELKKEVERIRKGL